MGVTFIGEEIKIDETFKIDCNSQDKVLYKALLGGQTRYFLTDKKGSVELYTLGCQSLIYAMGLNPESAFEIPSYLITETNVFIAKDELDINCSAGLEPSEKSNWKREDLSDVNKSGSCDGIEDCIYFQRDIELWWAKRSDSGLRNWAAAVSFCDGLTYGGHDDWRLPSKDEAIKAHQDGIWGELKTVLFDSSPSTWTAPEKPDAQSSQAWIVNLSNGSGSLKPKNYATINAAMCVRQKSS